MSVREYLETTQGPGPCECGGGDPLTEAMRQSYQEAMKNNIPVGYTKVKEEITTTCYKVPDDEKYINKFSSNIITRNIDNQYNPQRNFSQNQNQTNYFNQNLYGRNIYGDSSKYKLIKRVNITPVKKRNTYTNVPLNKSYGNFSYNYRNTDGGFLINNQNYKNYESSYGFDKNNRYSYNKNNYTNSQKNFQTISANRSSNRRQFRGRSANTSFNRFTNRLQGSRSLERSICSDIEQDGNMRYLESKIEISPKRYYKYTTEQHFKGLNNYPSNSFRFNKYSGKSKSYNNYNYGYDIYRNYKNFDFDRQNNNNYNDNYNYEYNQYYNENYNKNYNNEYNKDYNSEYNNVNVFDSSQGKFYNEDYENNNITHSQILPLTTIKKTTIKSISSSENNYKNSLSNLRTTGKTFQKNDIENLKTRTERYEDTEVSKDGKFLVSITLDKKVPDEEELEKQRIQRLKEEQELNEEQYNLNKRKNVEERISTIRTRPIDYGDNYKYHESKCIRKLKPSKLSATLHKRRGKINVYGNEQYETEEIKKYTIQPESGRRFKKKSIRTVREYDSYDYLPQNKVKGLHVQTEAMTVPGYNY